jgi:hypothetical protein
MCINSSKLHHVQYGVNHKYRGGRMEQYKFLPLKTVDDMTNVFYHDTMTSKSKIQCGVNPNSELKFGQLLLLVDQAAVMEILWKRHSEASKPKKCKKADLIAQYTKVISTILSKKDTKPHDMPILVTEVVDTLDSQKYTDVVFLNKKYVAPPKNTKPWGGSKPPKGYYNINLKKYNKHYGFGYSDWGVYKNSIVLNEAGIDDINRLVAEILYEITFYGYTEEDARVFFASMNQRIKEARQEVKKQIGKDGKIS